MRHYAAYRGHRKNIPREENRKRPEVILAEMKFGLEVFVFLLLCSLSIPGP